MSDRLVISKRKPKLSGRVRFASPYGEAGRFLGLPWWAWVIGTAGAVAMVAFVFKKRKVISAMLSKTVDLSQIDAFALALPSGPDSYAMEILNASEQYGVSPWVLAGVMYRESRGGDALTPEGAGGTGDFTPRMEGNTYFKYANPATGLPPDGLGWGRGLMQIDYGAQNAWVTTHDWADPQVNVNYAADILSKNQAYFQRGAAGDVTVDAWRLNGSSWLKPWTSYGLTTTGPFPDPRPLSGTQLTEATMASYNGGTSGVLQAVAAGLPADAATASNDYVSWIVSRAEGWASSFG